ncbi:MAG: hypothetical protein MK171_12185 [Pirellulales bacterium]|nr:hypothetical protein [Pirellulales bacterium]
MAKTNKGPWSHRLLIGSLTFTMAILCIWLLGFVIDDIGSMPGPDYEAVRDQLLDPALVEQQKSVEDNIAKVERQIKDQNARQQLLQDSTTNSQETMNQLLEFQRLSLQKDVKPSVDEQEAMAESQRSFLENQKQYQALNQASVQLNEKLSQLQGTQRTLGSEIEQQQVPIQKQIGLLYDQHEFKVAIIKLAVLLPLLLVVVWLLLKYREGTYALLIYALAIAVTWKVALVMHEHFPTRYFKYILILTALAIVIRILVYLLQMVAFPKKEWLLRQYREAYEFFLCPVCTYPIRRGPLTYRFWDRRSIKKIQSHSNDVLSEETAYTCPVCTTQLYEICTQCSKIRPGLLPACPHCGQVYKLIQETTS